MRMFLCLLVLFQFNLCYAETPEVETSIKFGVGVFNSAKDSRAEVKALSYSHSEELWDGIRQRFEVMGWLDSRKDIGRSPGGYADYALGIDVNPGYMYAAFYMGAGLKLPNDSLLGSPLQFTEDLCVGVRDNRMKSMGFCYKHISNAGLLPGSNVGRDFVILSAGVPF